VLVAPDPEADALHRRDAPAERAAARDGGVLEREIERLRARVALGAFAAVAADELGRAA
jgi:hypothetical protein